MSPLHAFAHVKSAVHSGLATQAFICTSQLSKRHFWHAGSASVPGQSVAQLLAAQSLSKKALEIPSWCALSHDCAHAVSPGEQVFQHSKSALQSRLP